MVERTEVKAEDGAQPFAPGETPPEGFEDHANPNPAAEGGEEGGEKKLAGKFDKPEDLEQAYLELQKKLGERTGEEGAEGKEGKEGKEGAEGSDQEADPTLVEARETLKARGLDMDEFSTEIEKDGKLSDASYEKLSKAGYSKFMVDSYIKGLSSVDPEAAAQAAQVSQEQVTEIKSLAGGDEGYTEMVTWASQNLSAEETAAFDKAVDSGDPHAAKIAVRGLKALYDAENGSEGNLLKGGSRPSRDVFRSRQEQMAAMADPRYGSDPAYTKDVEEKSLRSDVL